MSDDAAQCATETLPPAGGGPEAIAARDVVQPLVIGGTSPAKSDIRPYDFRNPAFLSEAELRRLRLRHEEMVRHLSTRLSLHLRMELGLKIGELTTATYATLTDALPNPTHLTLFKAEPLVGVGILDLNSRLALTIADRLLGGRGQMPAAARYLTEIEIALIEDVIAITLEEWSAQWQAEQELRPLVIGHENNGRFLQTSPRDAIVLVVTLECTFGECHEQLRIGVPYYMIEPLVKGMQARRQKESAASPAPKRAEWQPVHESILVPVRAEWEAFELAIREIASLRLGDVLELPPSICADTRLLVNGSSKFIGTVGLEGGRVAVHVTRKISPEDFSHGKPVGRKDA